MRFCTSTTLVATGIVACITAGALALRQAEPGAADARPAAPAQPGQPRGDLGAMLVGGLKATPGCLGVDTAKFQSGKNTIFAWFENREAVLRWHDSETHKAAMGMFFPSRKSERTPLEGVPQDYTGPIMAIAAITFASAEEQQKNGGRPFTQISIELYAPLKGGLAINGTLAPESMKIPGGKDLTGAYADKPKPSAAQ